MSKLEEKNLFYVNIARIFAVFSVVLLHSAAPLVDGWGSISRNEWLVAIFYDSFSKYGVSLFVMLSGSLLLCKQEEYISFFLKRGSKVLIPLFVWSAIYLGWLMIKSGQIFSFKYAVLQFVNGSVYYHLWFLYMILGLYLLTPILRKLIPALSKNDWKYLLFLWLALNSLVPLMQFFTRQYLDREVHFAITLPFVELYLGYYILGFFLSKASLTENKLTLAKITLVLSVIANFFGTSFFSLTANNSEQILFNNWSPTVIGQSVSLFVLIRYYADLIVLPSFCQKIIKLLAELSFGVYLVHAMILEILANGFGGVTLSGFSYNPFVAVPLTAITTFLISVIICALIAKIPLAEFTIGLKSKRRTF